jgi:septum formation topological specificity factor MinE
MKKIVFSQAQVKRIKKTLSKDKVENDRVAVGELTGELSRVLSEYMYINGKSLSVRLDKQSSNTKVVVTVSTGGFKPVITRVGKG